MIAILCKAELMIPILVSIPRLTKSSWVELFQKERALPKRAVRALPKRAQRRPVKALPKRALPERPRKRVLCERVLRRAVDARSNLRKSSKRATVLLTPQMSAAIVSKWAMTGSLRNRHGLDFRVPARGNVFNNFFTQTLYNKCKAMPCRKMFSRTSASLSQTIFCVNTGSRPSKRATSRLRLCTSVLLQRTTFVRKPWASTILLSRNTLRPRCLKRPRMTFRRSLPQSLPLSRTKTSL